MNQEQEEARKNSERKSTPSKQLRLAERTSFARACSGWMGKLNQGRPTGRAFGMGFSPSGLCVFGSLVSNHINIKTTVDAGLPSHTMMTMIALRKQLLLNSKSCSSLQAIASYSSLTLNPQNSTPENPPKLRVPFDPISYRRSRPFSTKTDDDSAIDAGSSIRKPISLWPGMYHSPVTNALWEARSNIFDKPGVEGIGMEQSELVVTTPAQSRTSILYKFSSDFKLREQYRNPWNGIRIGKLLEDLDALAGTIAYKHCCNEDGTTRPLLLVTASVDKMVLKKPIRVDIDLNIVGAVVWVGNSSMEIQLQVTQSMDGTPSDSVALVANFTFVARDSQTGKSAPVNQIKPETEKEKLLWEAADKRNKMRRNKRGQHKIEAGDKDASRPNTLLAEGRVFCDLPALADRDSILIRDTCLQNSFICQPQQRNIHGRIFGGFLMRRAFELAFSTTYAFAGVAPHFLEVDHVDFVRPVDVGNFLRLKSSVLYTELENPAEPLINVEVVAHVTQPELRSSEVSNKFYFTFSVHPEALKDGVRIRNVVPATEEEALRVIERMDAENSQIAAS